MWGAEARLPSSGASGSAGASLRSEGPAAAGGASVAGEGPALMTVGLAALPGLAPCRGGDCPVALNRLVQLHLAPSSLLDPAWFLPAATSGTSVVLLGTQLVGWAAPGEEGKC